MSKTAGEAIVEFLEEVRYVDKFHPESDEELLFQRRYRIAFYCRPDGMLPCHSCQKNDPKSTPIYVDEDRMHSHCRLHHPKAQIRCQHNKCTTMFISQAEKEHHLLYCHKKPYGWWILG